jgi:hypothetical protein
MKLTLIFVLLIYLLAAFSTDGNGEAALQFVFKTKPEFDKY